MYLTDAQAHSLKLWLIKKLSHDSDADSDILADYVLALVRGDDAAADLRATCVDNLRDFLQNGTERFVDEVLHAIKSGTYLKPVEPLPVSIVQPTLKRPRDPDEEDETARGGFDARRKHARRNGRRIHAPIPGLTFNSSILPSGMSMHDALSAMAAMQQAMGLPPLKGMDEMLHQVGNAPAHGQPQRCYDYAAHAYCPRGSSCPFDHSDPILPRTTYTEDRDARGSASSVPMRVLKPRGRSVPLRRDRRRRSALSDTRPNRDKSNTTIIVEQIPEANCTDHDIRAFFSSFGDITSLVLHAEQTLAVVTYSTWEEANAAYQSSKPIFDNRFVKVFWRRSITPSSHEVAAALPEASFDLEEVVKRQSQAQERHDAAQRSRNEAAAQKLVVDARLRKMEEERRDLSKRFAAKTHGKAEVDSLITASSEPESKLITGLRAQLAKLEAEAQTLGLELNEPGQTTAARHMNDSVRSKLNSRVWSGRGRRGARGPAVRRLDNRSKSVSMMFSDSTYDQAEEALRRYLLLSGQLEDVNVSGHPEHLNAAILVFKERYQAENLIAAVAIGHNIPDIGSVELEWLPADTSTAPASHSILTIGPTDDLGALTSEQIAPIDVRPDVALSAEPVNGFDIDEGTQWD